MNHCIIFNLFEFVFLKFELVPIMYEQYCYNFFLVAIKFLNLNYFKPLYNL